MKFSALASSGTAEVAGAMKLALASAFCLALAACGGSDGNDLAAKHFEDQASVDTGPAVVEAAPDRDGDDADSSAAEPGTAILSWDATPDSNVVGYRVYYGTAAGAYQQTPGSGVAVGNVNAHKLAGLTSGQTYHFAVTAVDATGEESPYSKEVTRTIP